MAILVNKDSKIAIQGITGREASMVVKHAIAYGTPIAAGITPGKEGQDVEGARLLRLQIKAGHQHHLECSPVRSS